MSTIWKLRVAFVIFMLIALQLNNTQLYIFVALVVGYFVVQSMINHKRRLREYRLRHRLCLRCEYDLRGITSDRCPECGEPCAITNSEQNGTTTGLAPSPGTPGEGGDKGLPFNKPPP